MQEPSYFLHSRALRLSKEMEAVPRLRATDIAVWSMVDILCTLQLLGDGLLEVLVAVVMLLVVVQWSHYTSS